MVGGADDSDAMLPASDGNRGIPTAGESISCSGGCGSVLHAGGKGPRIDQNKLIYYGQDVNLLRNCTNGCWA